jgi:hypothetical protein
VLAALADAGTDAPADGREHRVLRISKDVELVATLTGVDQRSDNQRPQVDSRRTDPAGADYRKRCKAPSPKRDVFPLNPP